jgi:ketosteroid isomerase-like protein
MKNYFFVFALLAASCTTNNKPIAPVSTANGNVLKTTQQLFTYFNQHNWQAIASLYTDTAEMLDPAFGTQPVYFTHAQNIEKYTALHKAIPDIKDSIVTITTTDTIATVQFISQGTAPNGKKFSLPICAVLTVKNGKISKDYTYYDNE